MSRAVSVDDGSQEIEVRLGSAVDWRPSADETDVFAKSVSEIRKMDGLTPATKRNATRAMQKFQRGAGGAKTKREERDELTGYNLFEVVLPPYNLDYLAALYEKSSPHAAAVKAKVRNIVGLGYEFVESDATKETLDRAEGNEEKLARLRRKLARGKRDLVEWLDSCNEEDEFAETLAKAWTDYETTGNGYIEIGRKNTGEIGYVGHIPSTTMRIRKKRDGFIQIISNRAVFFRNFGDTETADPIGNDPRPNEVIHLKNYTPTNGYYGVPDIISAMTAVTGNEFSARFNLDYFENKAVPRYVIVIKGGNLSPRSEQQILEFFQSSVKGKNHRTLYVPLPAEEEGKKVSFEMKPVEAGTQDSSFNNYRKGNLNEILMAHGVPISKVSLGEGVSLAAARDADKTFKEQVCRPAQRILEKKLNKIIKELTDVFTLRLNELSLTDEDTQSKIDERYLRLGTYLPNEVRARKGLPGIKGGDKPVELKPQQQAEQRAQAGNTRTRDQNRDANSPDSAGEARNPKGEGRQVA
ncbi:portal protein [Streptomyces phage Wakanda]|uniref:Portal protein n=1 Tax=Streptomyces phage Wakanda TaxID=2713267 RepID=A0A6G8R1F5_9CAUD|nr:portal protein [Streptomyces phage Wakanda]QIN94013.1 portal protein [Streptomyces phage Wakanda]